MKKAIKILVVILVAAAIAIIIHRLPGFESLMREIHGG
jgi:hypothetical protein